MSVIKIDLLPSPNFAAGVEFNITNHGKQAIRILKWGTPFDDVESDCLHVRLNGIQDCAFVGRQFKRVYQEEISTLLLKPGETLARSVHIPASWKLPAQGSYSVSLKAPRIQVIRSTGKTSANKSQKQWAVQNVEVGSITIFVENPLDSSQYLPLASDFSDPPGALSRDDIDQLRNEKQGGIPVCPPMFLCISPSYQNTGECFMARYIGHPKMSSGTKDLGTIKNYADLMKRAMAYILSIRGDWNFANDMVFRKWFGIYTPQRAERVANGLNGALGAISCFNFVLYLDNSNTSDVIAWWRASDDPSRLSAMGFCNAYFQLPEGGMNSKMGSIAHELTHAFARTKDHAYGFEKCMQLAKSQPDLAIENADNYEFFIEEKLQLQPF